MSHSPTVVLKFILIAAYVLTSGAFFLLMIYAGSMKAWGGSETYYKQGGSND